MSPALGSVKPGTVGRLATGRLVLVERVSPFAAYLISLPEQHDEFRDVDHRFFGDTRTISTSPFITLYTVDTSSLTDANLLFLRNFGYPVDGVPEPEPEVENPEDVLAEIEELKRELARLEET